MPRYPQSVQGSSSPSAHQRQPIEPRSHQRWGVAVDNVAIPLGSLGSPCGSRHTTASSLPAASGRRIVRSWGCADRRQYSVAIWVSLVALSSAIWRRPSWRLILPHSLECLALPGSISGPSVETVIAACLKSISYSDCFAFADVAQLLARSSTPACPSGPWLRA